MISSDATIDVKRAESDQLIASLRPYISLVASGVRSGLALHAAVDIAHRKYPELSKHFLIENDLSTFGLKRHLLFPVNDRINRFFFRNRRIGQTLQINDLTQEEVREIGNMLQVLSTAEPLPDLRETLPYPELVDALRKVEILVNQTSTTDWKMAPGRPGILRLHHASFLLQTEKASVLVDPHFVSVYSADLRPGSFMLPHNFNNLAVNAILITHSHEDHYHLPSLMMMPRDILMIVPRVPEESILCPLIAEDLRSLGFRNVVEADWYSGPIRVEDIEIWPLPFYGEQPLRYEHPRDPGLRNWGNSYVFRTPGFSTWCLIDSGSDASGSMMQVAERVSDLFGAIDVILSNLHEFFVGVGRANPFYTTGSGEYWLALTADQIVRFPKMHRDMITLGPKGVAEICAQVHATTFLPYAHLWSEFGSTPSDELQMLHSLHAQPALANSRIRIENWRIGDLWQP